MTFLEKMVLEDEKMEKHQTIRTIVISVCATIVVCFISFCIMNYYIEAVKHPVKVDNNFSYERNTK